MSFKSELRETTDLTTPELFFNLMDLALTRHVVITLAKHLGQDDEKVLYVKMQRVDCKPITIYTHFGPDFYNQYMYARDFLLGYDTNKHGKFIDEYFI